MQENAESVPRRWQKTLPVSSAQPALELLATETELSKQKIKDAMLKGAVWLKRGKKNRKRLRRAKADLLPNDLLEINYDPLLLGLQPGKPELLADFRDYSVWFKPSGMLSQGTEWGDHCALLRIAEQTLSGRDAFLVHRLDKNASGLMIVAHNGKATARLGNLLQARDVSKRYRALVMGTELPGEGSFCQTVEGKASETRFKKLGEDPDQQHTLVEIDLITGRKHQIRHHFSGAGWPLIGDPEYGGPKSKLGLCLIAIELGFRCPMKNVQRWLKVSDALMPDWAKSHVTSTHEVVEREVVESRQKVTDSNSQDGYAQ